MARIKTAKRPVKKGSVQSKNNTLAFLQEIEQDFLQVPATLAMQLNKEISTLKVKENKLKNAVSKLKAQLKTSEARLKTAGKGKTSSDKKRLTAAKKSHQDILKTHSSTDKELQELAKIIATTVNKQAKFTAISKQLNQFEKEWAKKSKKNKATKAKVKAKTKSRKASSSVAAPVTLDDEPKRLEPAQSIVDHVTLDETTELTS